MCQPKNKMSSAFGSCCAAAWTQRRPHEGFFPLEEQQSHEEHYILRNIDCIRRFLAFRVVSIRAAY
jgi:hypothetical protein